MREGVEYSAEAKAWRRIARIVHDRTHSQADYLCHAVDSLYSVWLFDESISADQHAAMRARINKHTALQRYGSAFGYFGHPDLGRNSRVIAALLMACECEDEARELQSSTARKEDANA